jgi:polyhydroxyalkanoate synthase
VPDPAPAITSLAGELQQAEARTRTLRRVATTRYPVGQTPKEVIWTLNKAKLYHYIPTVPAEQRHRVPLLLVFALMNRPYILDLRPGNSFVEYMVGQGYEVYLLDWGAPGWEDKDLTFGDYVLDYLPRAIRKLQQVAGTPDFSLLGWCIGALLTTCYAALRPNDGLRNLILLTAPLDFADKEANSFTRLAAEADFDVDEILAMYGNMPGELLDYGARALKPVESYIMTYQRLFDNLDNPRIVESWHAMNTWVSDLIPMAGATYRQLIIELYRENRLMAGTWQLRGERVDLRKLRANLLNVIAESDHITPPCQSETLLPRVAGVDKQLLRVPGGHIGIMAGSGAVKGTWPQIESWLAGRSD